MAEIAVDVNDCASKLRVRLRIYGSRRLRVCLWLLSRLLGLAEFVSGMCIIAEIDDGNGRSEL